MFFIVLITTEDSALRRKRVMTTQKMFKRFARRTHLWHTVMYTKCFYSYYSCYFYSMRDTSKNNNIYYKYAIAA